MFQYFRNTLVLIRNRNIYNGKHNYPRRIVERNVPLMGSMSRKLCLCGTALQNFTEKDTRYRGVHITIEKAYHSREDFESDLLGLFAKWRKDKKRSVFLQVPIDQSDLISVASKYGFVYHHARDHHAVLSLWLDDSSKNKLPTFANHTVGVAGACFNEESKELLLVQDRGGYSKWWKFPGGFSEIGEFVGDTAVRETAEETGIQSRFESVLSIRQQHGTLFNQSDFYFICRLHPLTREIHACPDEIVACKWVPIDEVLAMPDSTPFVKLVCNLLLKGLDNDFQHVDISAEEMMSWLRPDLKYILYHRKPEN